MKKKFAVLNLIAQHSVRKVLAVLAILVVADAAAFLPGLDPEYVSLYREFDQMGMYLVYAACFVLLTLILCLSMCDRGGRQNLFLYRLDLHPRTVFWNHAAYNSFCYCLLYMVQALALLVLCVITEKLYPDRFTHQTIFLTTYQSGLIHSFLPLEDWMLGISNLVMIVTLGICTAALPTRNRSGKASITTFVAVLLALTVVYLQTIDVGGLDVTTRVIALFCSVMCALSSVAGIWDLEVDPDA